MRFAAQFMNQLTHRLLPAFTACALFSLSPMAYAASQTPWKTYLFSVMAISTIAATVLSLRNKKADSRMAKLLLAWLYFWVFTFGQLIILAFLYYINK